MRLLRRIGTGIAGLILVAALMQLAAPRAVHGVVATLVSVVGNVAVSNPASGSGGVQPLVVQDAEVKALQPFRQSTVCIFDANFDCTNAVAQVAGTQVLVINDISGFCTLPPGDFLAAAKFHLQTKAVLNEESQVEFPSGFTYVFIPESSLGPVNDGTNYAFGRQTYIVLDSTYTALVSDVETVSPPTGSGGGAGKNPTATCTVTYSGYYVHL